MNRPLPKLHPAAVNAARVVSGIHRKHGSRASWTFLREAAAAGKPPRGRELTQWVKAAGGSGADVATWIADKTTANDVDVHVVRAVTFGVRATPTLFVNGGRLDGLQSKAALTTAVSNELRRAEQVLRGGVAASDIYAARTRKNLINVGDEVVIRDCPDIGSSPTRGPADAPVVIVEFSDFECPFCRRVQPTIEKLLKRYPRDIRLVWKNLPLKFHKLAVPAANLALAAFDRSGVSKFWAVHDDLFAATVSSDRLGADRRARGTTACHSQGGAQRWPRLADSQGPGVGREAWN